MNLFNHLHVLMHSIFYILINTGIIFLLVLILFAACWSLEYKCGNCGWRVFIYQHDKDIVIPELSKPMPSRYGLLCPKCRSKI